MPDKFTCVMPVCHLRSRLQAIIRMTVLITSLSSCNSNDPKISNISNSKSNGDKNDYIAGADLKKIIIDNIIMTDQDRKYGGGTLYYPNGTGMLFSEGTFRIRYTIIDGSKICVTGINNFCSRFYKSGGQLMIEVDQSGQKYTSEAHIKPFNR